VHGPEDDDINRRAHSTPNNPGMQQQTGGDDFSRFCNGASLNDTGGEYTTEEHFAIFGDRTATAEDIFAAAEDYRRDKQDGRNASRKKYANKEASIEAIEAALDVIPNDDKFLAKLNEGWGPWDIWNNVGLATYAATGGSDDGLDLFHKWSLKYPGYNEKDTEDRWTAFRKKPPRSSDDGIGAGSLFHWADIADPSWRDKIKRKDRPLPVISNAGEHNALPPPRAWLLSNYFCRGFLSSLFGDGGVGKTALRYVQYVSLAIGRPLLAGEHVFQRCRVLIVSLEDNEEELSRRIWAVRIFYNIKQEELDGWLFLWAPKADDGKLMTLDRYGNPRTDDLKDSIEALIVHHSLDFIALDPWVKAHGVGENDNNLIDKVAGVVTDMCSRFNIAVDAPHHVNKGQRGADSEPGDANRGRGASAMKDAARLVHTLNTMTKEEAKTFGINEEDRHSYIRVDKGKVNIAPPSRRAVWRRLVGVKLGNATAMYPSGDEVQTVEAWTPPDVMFGLSNAQVVEILKRIEEGMEDGRRYTHVSSAKTRAAWKVVVDVEPKLDEKQAREIIRAWMKDKVLVSKEYRNEKDRKDEEGLWRNGVDEDVPF
jgi:RecA-family ATPase